MPCLSKTHQRGCLVNNFTEISGIRPWLLLSMDPDQLPKTSCHAVGEVPFAALVL